MHGADDQYKYARSVNQLTISQILRSRKGLKKTRKTLQCLLCNGRLQLLTRGRGVADCKVFSNRVLDQLTRVILFSRPGLLIFDTHGYGPMLRRSLGRVVDRSQNATSWTPHLSSCYAAAGHLGQTHQSRCRRLRLANSYLLLQ